MYIHVYSSTKYDPTRIAKQFWLENIFHSIFTESEKRKIRIKSNEQRMPNSMTPSDQKKKNNMEK